MSHSHLSPDRILDIVRFTLQYVLTASMTPTDEYNVALD